MIRPEQIANAKFTPVSAGTYSAEEVDAFLATVAEAYAAMQNQNSSLIKKISILAEKVEEYRKNEDAIKNALLDAHKLAESVNKEASEKANAVLTDAQAKAKEISDNASKHADELANAARTQAGDIVNNARTAVASLTERAEKEAAGKVAAAQAQAEEIVGESRAKYEFYTSELEKIKEEMNRFKAMVEKLCSDNNIDFSTVIPAVTAVERSVEKVDEFVAQEFAPAAEEKPEEIPAEPEIIEEVIEEPAEEIAEPAPQAIAEEEADEEDDAADEGASLPPVEITNAEDEDDGLKIPVKADSTDKPDDDDDLFALFDEEPAGKFDFASDIDNILPDIPVSAPAAAPAADSSDFDFSGFDDSPAQADDDDDFEKKISESIGVLDDDSASGADDGDDDITSLFDSLFDD